jgi:hypothetical protein
MSGRPLLHRNAARAFAIACGVALAAGAAAVACSSDNATILPTFTGVGSPGGDAGTVVLADDAGHEAKPFPSGGPRDPGAGAVYATISGESNALTGYPFPPGDFMADTYMIDGWQFVIREFIVNVDKITLWANPNVSPTDPSQHGPAVAHLDGPFVVDLHKGGSLVGQGGAPERATALGVLANQNDNGGGAFDPTTTYGFGFSTVAASYAGYNVNLGASQASDFDYMVQNGYSVLYGGTATWRGGELPAGCTETNTGESPAAGFDPSDAGDAALSTNAKGGYDFAKIPPTMTFRLGFSTPTNYVNCQNFTAQGVGIGGEASPRGIQVSTSQSAIAQVTVHMDHPFWESLAEDSPVHWDQIAAQYVGMPGIPEAHTEDMIGVPFYAFTDRNGTPLPWRNCAGSNYTAPGNGQMFFNSLSVPVNPSELDPSKALRDYYDYVRYTQSTQGHLNSQGLCFIDRQYPAPPGGS